MRQSLALMSALLLVACMALAWQAQAAPEVAGPSLEMLSHNIYFSLKDPTPESRQKLVEACEKYLAPHPGVVFFACGTLCDDIKGIFNDRDYDVALTMVFKDHAALKAYARTDEHQQFVAESTAMLKKVRIFDADVRRTAVPDDAPAKK